MNSATMSPEEKLKELTRGLLEKTKARLVNWVPSQDKDREYTVALPHSWIRLRYINPRALPDFITLAFFNAGGVLVGALKAEEPDPEEEGPNPDWDLLNSLFTEVHRSAAGWDTVVDEIEKALAGPGPVGNPAPRPGLTGTFNSGRFGVTEGNPKSGN